MDLQGSVGELCTATWCETRWRHCLHLWDDFFTVLGVEPAFGHFRAGVSLLQGEGLRLLTEVGHFGPVYH